MKLSPLPFPRGRAPLLPNCSSTFADAPSSSRHSHNAHQPAPALLLHHADYILLAIIALDPPEHLAMASVASERIPIATLHPSLPAPATKSITALVTILWPYSSSTRTCALLLCEPDFRLRRRRGQVRVQFSGDAAYAVATSQLGIGDKVVLKLGGVQWLQSSGEEEVVRTPGKSVDWELGFRDRLAMLVTRDQKQFANIEVERNTPEQSEEELEEEAVYDTPSKIVGRFSAEGLRFNTWSSPAFLKHSRLSGESISSYDLFDDDDESKSRKRRRTSFKNVGVWTYAARTPSPEKEDIMSLDVDALASPSERTTAHALLSQDLELPHTPVSARMTPAEVSANQEDELVPEPAHETQAPGEHAAQNDLREQAIQHDDALYEQYLEEVHEGQEGDTEVDEHSDEPEDELVAQFSVQDARLVQNNFEPESLPFVIPDTDVAVPSAAASIRVDDSVDNTEQDSAVEDFEVVEQSSTEADSEAASKVQLPGYSDTRDPESQSKEEPVSARIRQSEDSDNVEKALAVPSSQGHDGLDESRTISDQVPEDLSSTWSEIDKREHEDTHDRSEARAEDDADEGKPQKESQKRSSGPKLTETTVQEAEELALSGVTAAPIMPPPVLPQLQTEVASSKSPSTPQLQPVTSTTLPLPSPFPAAAEATSYMDARPISSIDPSTFMTTGQEQHELRPATAISVAQAAHEALRDPQNLHPNESALDPVLQMTEQAPGAEIDDSGHGRPSIDLQFGFDGSSQSVETRKVPDIVDLQDTQLYDPVSTPDAETMEAEEDRPDSTPTVQALHGMPSLPTHLLGGEEGPTSEVPQQMAQQLEPQDLQLSAVPASDGLRQSDATKRSPQPQMKETSDPKTFETYRETPDKAEEIGKSMQSAPASDDVYLPVFQDDDWDMSDAEAEAGNDSTPKATDSERQTGEAEITPTATPQKRITTTLASPAMQAPVSSAAEIVDLGSDSVGEEAQETSQVAVVDEMGPPAAFPGKTAEDLASVEDYILHQEVTPSVEPVVKQERLRSSPPVSPPRTRRRTRQSTIETVSQADALTPPRRRTRQSTMETTSQAERSTPARSQRRSLRSSQASRTSLPPQGISGVAARVAQRRRRVEVKDSECEWDSNASISTQRPSSPSAPSDPASLHEFVPSAGPEPSQVLGELSQMERHTREKSIERPSISPISDAAPIVASDSPPHATQAPEEDKQEAQNMRLQSELEGPTTDDLATERSSSPFPELNFEWGPRKQKAKADAQVRVRPDHSSILRDEFDHAGPTHSSILQDNSSVLRAMRTSQFPFGTQRAQQDTPSVEDVSQQIALAESQTQVANDQTPSLPQARATSSPKDGEESQVTLAAASLREEVEESQFEKVEWVDSQDALHPKSEAPPLLATAQHPPLVEATATSKPVTTESRTLQESNVLTPEASQEVSQVRTTVQADHMDSALPPTPGATQMTSTAPIFSQDDSPSAQTQILKPSMEQREEAADVHTAEVASLVDESSSDEATQLEPSQKSNFTRKIKWTPSQLSQGTRTSYSYFTPLSHLASYTNSQSGNVDVLAVCTAPNKAPVRATAGPRDYTSLFSVTDMSLENGTEVRVQVFRPWKAALPECDVGDTVLLRGFQVKSRKGKPCLISGQGSAWCVFRYGAVEKWRSAGASQANSQEVTDAEGEDGEKGGKKGHAKRKSNIMESTKPIWADVMSGLWGAVASQEEKPAPEGETGDAGDNTASVETLHNSVSGATREEVHGPPVEYGDEERREAKGLREWWVGLGGRKGTGKEVKPERRARYNTRQKTKDDKDKGGKTDELKEERRESFSSKDFFKKFL